jgi:predicted permease
MRLPRKIRFRLGGLFGRGRFNAEMDAEMKLHLELRIEKNIASGMPPREAREAALRAFGGLEQVKEHARDQRGGAWLGQLGQDVLFGLRMLRGNPGFAAVAVLSLALGIGAATSVFSLVNAMLLGSLAVPDPEELRVICWSGKEVHMQGYMTSGDPVVPGKRAGASFSKEAFLSIRAQCAPQCDVFGYVPFFNNVVRARVAAVGINGQVVSGNFFSGLGVRPRLGSLLDARDEDAGSPPRAVISYPMWERQFALDPGAIGQQISLGGHDFTIAGVLPQEFKGVLLGESTDLYIPLSAAPLIFPHIGNSAGEWWIALMGRVRPGVGRAQLQAVLDTALRGSAGKFITAPEAYIADGRDGAQWDTLGYRSQLRLLLAVVGVVVLVACANLAGLLLARGASRHHELAVRVALGAGRSRLVRQLLTESALLSILGGGIGVATAVWGRIAVSRLLAGSSAGLHFDMTLDLKVLGFASAVTLLTVLLAGLYPALKAGKVDPQGGLTDRAAVGVPRLRAGQFLVAAQIALSLLLVTGAGLYLRTLVNLVRINPGFAIDHLLLFSLDPGDSGYDETRSVAYFDRVQRSLASIPGVGSVALVNISLLGGGLATTSLTVPAGRSGEGEIQDGASTLTVGEAFFETMGIPILAGRALRAGDASGAAKAIVVNEAFVRKFLPNGGPVGRTINFGADWQVVGVCRDAKYNSIKDGIGPTVYFSFRQLPVGRATIAMRTLVAPQSVAAEARKAIAAIDANIPISNPVTEEQMRDGNITTERMFAESCGALALLALLLSGIGLYGMMAYDMVRRTREMGVRIALGATPRQLLLPLLRQALMLGCAGVATGLPLALVLTRVTEANLYGVTSTDPATFSGAAILLIAVILFAAWIPSRRAARVDPLIALRCE